MSTRPPSPIHVRLIKAWDEYLAAEELQSTVWQMPNWRDVVPANFLIVVQKAGGFVIGAFDSSVQDRLVGLAMSFLGFDSGQARPMLRQCSHMVAVLPEYQSQKIGLRLKHEQRRLTLAQGTGLMTWTYDPLLALNGHLNIARLGAIARRYVPNAYGEMTDGLNAGVSSDRFEVEWWLNAPRVQKRVAAESPLADWDALLQAGATPIFEIERQAGGWPRIQKERELAGDCVLVEIPSQFAALKAASLELACDWRARTGVLLQRAFAAGYAATDFVTTHSAERRAAYVLTRQPVETGI